MAAKGWYSINEPSDSSASATKISPVPRWALEPEAVIVPPIAKDGSAAHACSATANMEDVVVFPCVPATATLFESDIRTANAAARVKIGIFNSAALARSGLLAEIAVEYTTRSAPSTCEASCDVATVAPNADKAITTDESFASDPLTVMPWDKAMRANPLIPAPPMPMK